MDKKKLENAMSSIQAEQHEFCKWLEEKLADENGFINDRSMLLNEIIDKIKDHELWT